MLFEVGMKSAPEQQKLTPWVVQLTSNLGVFVVSPMGGSTICVPPR